MPRWLARIREAIAAGRAAWSRSDHARAWSKPSGAGALQDWVFGQRPRGWTEQEYNESVERRARERR